jgi:formamidopyrimidine-DNA glycosylase
MPELPEVESVAAGLRSRIVGRQISEVECSLAKLLRATAPEELRALRGTRITAVGRRGKILIIETETRTLLFHLKMTGQFLWLRPERPRDKHTHLVLSFSDAPEELRFRDVRKFGFMRCLPSGEVAACGEIARLGPEPLEISRKDFSARLAVRRGRMKSMLLDQRVLAGVGNIYADEALHAAGIHPRTPAACLSGAESSRLWSVLRRILKNAIRAGGSSVRDYRGVGGDLGDFQTRHRVYGRAGELCRRCRGTIRRIVVGGRSTFFCPDCQRRKHF